MGIDSCIQNRRLCGLLDVLLRLRRIEARVRADDPHSTRRTMAADHSFKPALPGDRAGTQRLRKMPLPSVPTESQLQQAIALIAQEGLGDDDIEQRMAALATEPMLARRLIDWLPEAFGLVLVSHMEGVELPTGFGASDRDGRWHEFGFAAEPIFASAMRLAERMYHAGPRQSFARIARRSSIVEAASRALEQCASLEGARLSGPTSARIPAEVYASEHEFRSPAG